MPPAPRQNVTARGSASRAQPGGGDRQHDSPQPHSSSSQPTLSPTRPFGGGWQSPKPLTARPGGAQHGAAAMPTRTPWLPVPTALSKVPELRAAADPAASERDYPPHYGSLSSPCPRVSARTALPAPYGTPAGRAGHNRELRASVSLSTAITRDPPGCGGGPRAAPQQPHRRCPLGAGGGDPSCTKGGPPEGPCGLRPIAALRSAPTQRQGAGCSESGPPVPFRNALQGLSSSAPELSDPGQASRKTPPAPRTAWGSAAHPLPTPSPPQTPPSPLPVG